MLSLTISPSTIPLVPPPLVLPYPDVDRNNNTNNGTPMPFSITLEFDNKSFQRELDILDKRRLEAAQRAANNVAFDAVSYTHLTLPTTPYV